MAIDPFKIIEKYYSRDSLAYYYLVEHSKVVAQKAVAVARDPTGRPDMAPDLTFIEEAAMLHDIGIFYTDKPQLDCHGTLPYVCHGYLGRELLDADGLPLHALVCERHVGVGISLADIIRNNLPLPKRDMLPVSIEEQIICYADKFFSKNPRKLHREKAIEEIQKSLLRYGEDKWETFVRWHKIFAG